MAAKRNYSRYFIILQEDEKGYSTDNNKFPTGYAKIERKNDKCKVTYYVQNLKKVSKSYYMLLICQRKNDKRLVKVGEVNIDDNGRAELSHEYSINNIGNANISMDNIKGASIVNLDGSSVHGVLTGFISGAKLEDWKSYAMIEDIKREEHDDKDNKELKEKIITKGEEKEIEEQKQNNIFDEYERNIENSKNINNLEDNTMGEEKLDTLDKREDKIENIKEDINIEKDIQDKDKRNLEEDTKAKEVNQKVSDKIEEKVKENKESIAKALDSNKKIVYNDSNIKKEEKIDTDLDSRGKSDKNKKESKKLKEYCDDVEDFFESIFDDLEEIKDICPEVGKCKWYKINYKDFMDDKNVMDFNKYSILYYPMTSYYQYIKRHGHYLLGCKYDSSGKVKYLIYGIPGTKFLYDQPFGGATGFVTWIHKDYDKKNDNIGYWIMFYDFENATVVIPIKKKR